MSSTTTPSPSPCASDITTITTITMASLTTPSAVRTQLRSLSLSSNLPIQQIRHATLIKRPKRPYTFTQLITLSDGSTFTHRTTSPQTVYQTVKDTKNSPMWNPSSQKLMNVEEDDAGRLRKFRERFGRGFDAEAKEVIVEDEVGILFALFQDFEGRVWGEMIY
jgi:hypothetical protein